MKSNKIKFNNGVKLLQPPLLDFSTLGKKDEVKIVIHNDTHKFATDAEYSGKDLKVQPIFGSTAFINGKEFCTMSFGLPFMRFHKGSKPKITYVNHTPFTTNIHYHGLNTDGSTDGTDMQLVFGPSTQIGPVATFDLPEITNNQALLFFHSHNMFVSMELAYGGIVGLLQIVDKLTCWLNATFEYGNNQILLLSMDMEMTDKGVLNPTNLTTDDNRGNFTMINGTSAVSWYSSDPCVPFVNPLFHIQLHFYLGIFCRICYQTSICLLYPQ